MFDKPGVNYKGGKLHVMKFKLLIFLSESGPVSALEVNSVNDTTLLISWGEPVSPNGNIISYFITIADLRGDSTVRINNTDYVQINLGKEIINKRCYCTVLCSLEPGVPYHVSVAAENRVGQGEISTAVNFTRERSK